MISDLSKNNTVNSISIVFFFNSLDLLCLSFEEA